MNILENPSRAICSGCAKPIDPLRAGHVALIGGVFHYYCNAMCASKRRREHDAATQETAVRDVTPEIAEPLEELTPPPEAGAISQRDLRDARAALDRIVLALGIVAGPCAALAPLVGFAGLRAPLAGLATALYLCAAALSRQLFARLPAILFAGGFPFVVATIAWAAGAPHASGLMCFAGLSASALLLAPWMIHSNTHAACVWSRADVDVPLLRWTARAAEIAPFAAAAIVGVAAYAMGAAFFDSLAAAAAAAVAGGAAHNLACVVARTYERAHHEALASGISFRDGRAFERAGRANIAVLSARSAILARESEVVAVEPLAAVDVDRLLALAGGAEAACVHPIAAVVVRAAKKLELEQVRNAEVHPGLGVTAITLSGEALVVGRRALLLREGVSIALADARAEELETKGRTVLFVALGGKVVGLIALQNTLAQGARAAIGRLVAAHLEPVLMSGADRATCESIAHAVGVDHVRPEVIDRGKEIRALAEGGHIVAAIGHPARDRDALEAAGVAVALEGAGASENWTIALVSNDVRDAAVALELAKDTRERAGFAVGVGIAPPLACMLAIAFGFVPIFVSPVSLLLGVALSMTCVRR